MKRPIYILKKTNISFYRPNIELKAFVNSGGLFHETNISPAIKTVIELVSRRALYQ